MKALNFVAWVCGMAAGLIIILAFLALALDFHFFGINHVVNYFHAATSLLLLAIFCLLYNSRAIKKEN